MCKLKNVSLQAAVVGDNVGHGAEAYHSFAEQQFQAEQGLRTDRGESDDWNWIALLWSQPYIGQSASELYFGFRLKHFGDSQPVIPIHHDHFSPGDDPVPQQEFGWVLNVFVQLDYRSGPQFANLAQRELTFAELEYDINLHILEHRGLYTLCGLRLRRGGISAGGNLRPARR